MRVAAPVVDFGPWTVWLSAGRPSVASPLGQQKPRRELQLCATPLAPFYFCEAF